MPILLIATLALLYAGARIGGAPAVRLRHFDWRTLPARWASDAGILGGAPTVTAAPAGHGNAPPPKLIPFVRAATEVTTPGGMDRTNAISAAAVMLGPDDIPAYGFLRGVLIFVDVTGGTGSAAVYKEDAPWSILAEIVLSDVNGQPIVQLSGYEAYLAHKWGTSAAFTPEPTSSPYYVAPTTAGNFSFLLRIPVEVGIRDALGALDNMNASTSYKLRIQQADTTGVYSTNPTGLPTAVHVRAWLECWSNVADTDASGHPQQKLPAGRGTTQFWTRQTFNINAGFQTVKLARVGNLLRNLILILRTAAPARSDANFPDPVQLAWDTKPLANEPRTLRKHYMRERTNNATLDTGVFLYDFAHDFDGQVGSEMRDLWLPTIQSSRVEFTGNFGAAGTLVVVTNDITPVGEVFLD